MMTLKRKPNEIMERDGQRGGERKNTGKQKLPPSKIKEGERAGGRGVSASESKLSRDIFSKIRRSQSRHLKQMDKKRAEKEP